MTRSSYATASTRSLVVGTGVCPRTATKRAVGCALLLLALLLPRSAHAKLPAGTGITASKTAAGHLTSTSVWTIAKSADPASQTLSVGASTTVHWTITTTKSASGTLGAYFDGHVCVTNTGSRATQGLAIQDQLTEPPSTTVLRTVAVDVSAKPQLNPGETHCYPYTITVPAAAIVPGALYKDTARVTITNQSCCPGTATGPSPSATVALPTTPVPIAASITATDTNGQSFGFSSGGSQGYDEAFDCPSTPGTHTLDDTATIQSTGQTASAEATVHCIVYPQSNALAKPLCHELHAFGDCVSMFLDTPDAQCGGCNDDCCGALGQCCKEEDHHQGLARTPALSDGSIYFFLSQSGIFTQVGSLMQFKYTGAVDDEHVTQQGAIAPMQQLVPLADERHPSDIDFLPDVDTDGHVDSGYLFAAKEFDAKTVAVYYWKAGDDLQLLGELHPGLAKPSHIMVDRVRDYYYLVVLDNTPPDPKSMTRLGTAFRAYYTDLFPSGTEGSMKVSAFEVLPYFTFAVDLGSQAQLVRDSTNTPYVVTYNSPDDDQFGDDFVHVYDMTFDEANAVVTFGSEQPWSPIHFFLPEGGTGFANTGTHYVNANGRLLISSSERWAQKEGDLWLSRVDECVPGDYDAAACVGDVCGPGMNSCGEPVSSCTCPASKPKCCGGLCVCENCECP